MSTALWVVQGLLAVVFAMVGIMKLIQPKEKLLERMEWVEDFSPNMLRGIGLLEILGAIGLVAPLGLNIQEWLTPLAAAGLALTMIGAAVTHLRRSEMPNAGMNIILGLLAAFVAYGRFDLFTF